ncbi:hypothetical protein EBESD8_45070 [Rhodococcus aetherivorans]|nr:hypothetical protein EBESD8_45070 [Rhodococcus aetherivorans]
MVNCELPPLTGGDHARQRCAALLAGQMGLGGPPTTRPSPRVILRFGLHPAGWLSIC